MSKHSTWRHTHLLVSQAIIYLFVASVWPSTAGAQDWLPNRIRPPLISDPADYHSPIGYDESVVSSWSPETQALSQAVEKNQCGLAPLNELSGRANIEPYINRGDAAKSGEFPSFVMLNITLKLGNRTGYTTCGGTLISNRHVLTAAHCIGNAIDVKASLGGYHNWLWWREQVAYRRTECMGSKQYGYNRQNRTNDWVIVALTRSVRLTDYVQPACLPPIDARSNMRPLTSGPKSQCYIVGVGAISAKLIKPLDPKDLRLSYQYTLPDKEIRKLRVEEKDCGNYRIDREKDVSRTCYGAHSARGAGGACPGDSGGPVLCKSPQGRWTVMGVGSFGPVHCDYEKIELEVFTDTRKMQLSPAYKSCFNESKIKSASRHQRKYKSRVYFAQPDDLDILG